MYVTQEYKGLKKYKEQNLVDYGSFGLVDS